MHVGLNLVYLVPGETGGMEIYARELVAAMLALPDAPRLTAFVNREAHAGPPPWLAQLETVLVPVQARRRIEWVRGEQQLLPGLARVGVLVNSRNAPVDSVWVQNLWIPGDTVKNAHPFSRR